MRKFYSLLGLAKKAGKLIGGEVAVENAIKQKAALLLLIATDASNNTKKKFTNSATYYTIPFMEIGTKEDLGRAVGEEIRAVFAVTEAGFAKRLQELAQESDISE